MPRLDGKLMELKLKNGWSVSNFAEYLECSEEHFLNSLQKNFQPRVYKKMLNRLARNEKQKGRRSY